MSNISDRSFTVWSFSNLANVGYTKHRDLHFQCNSLWCAIKKTPSIYFFLDLENQILKKKLYVMNWHSPALDPPLRGSFFGKTTSNSIDIYLFLEISQIWQKWCLITLLPSQYVVLHPMDHKRAGERHSLRELAIYASIILSFGPSLRICKIG